LLAVGEEQVVDGQFVAEADIRSAAIARLARSPETDGLESRNP